MQHSVWFLNNDPQVAAGSTNEGTQANPFVSIDLYNASSLPRPGDIAFFQSGTYTGSPNLQDRQIVASKVDDFLAESASRWGDYSALYLPASFEFPQEPATIVSPTGTAVTLAKDNALIGISLSVGPDGYAIKGTDFGRLTLYDVRATGPGAKVDLENGSLHATRTEVLISSTSTTGPALRWAVGSMENGADGPPAEDGKHYGPTLALAFCNITGPDGGVDARALGSASAKVVATDSVISGGAGIAFAVTSQETSTLSATFTGNTVAGIAGDFWFDREDDSTFTFAGFTGTDADAATAFIQGNNVGDPRVFFGAGIQF
ncbi:MAG: hypothetical protein JW993_21090 [Sedimentisphaerales bacterium]|nr:hypothetical protein [Sedimentisphaerales bacterium]